MAYTTLIFTTSLILTLATSSISTSPSEIFILAGQSNMAGRGGVHGGVFDGIIPPESKPNPSIHTFSSIGIWRPAHDPLHVDIDTRKKCGIGPGMAFANAVRIIGRGLGRAQRAIGLVPCAVGGTRIDEWGKGSKLYEDMVRRAHEARRSAGGGGRIAAVLWFQGESDTVAAGDADSYGDKMEKLITDLRNDLNNSSLLFIQVALASGEGEYIERVRRAQLGIKLKNVKTVDAKGFGLGPDGLHLSTRAQARLGFKLAMAFLGLDSSIGRLNTLYK